MDPACGTQALRSVGGGVHARFVAPGACSPQRNGSASSDGGSALCRHVINDQDVVTRKMKLFRYYKRHGNRAIINARGDLVVRPSFLEFSLLQVCHQLQYCADVCCCACG